MTDVHALSKAWYERFNARDLDGVMALYAEDVRFTSPYIQAIGFDAGPTLTGRDAVRRYFEAGLDRIPDLRFEPVADCIGADSHVLVYRNQAGVLVAETHEYDDSGRIVRASAAYATPSKEA